MVITKSFSWDTSAKTTSWICSSCLKICRKTFVGILHPWIATVISSECSFLLTSNNFWSQTRYSEAALMLLSHYVSIYSFFWTHFPLFLFFFRLLLLINSVYLPFESSLSTLIFFPNFCFLYFFACSWSWLS